MTGGQIRNQSRRKQQQQHFIYQQQAYHMQFSQQPYMSAISPAFNQQQAPVYQHAQAASIYHKRL